MAFLSGVVNSVQTIADVPTQARTGWAARLLAAMMESRRKKADLEIARYIRNSGGKLTDDLERDILLMIQAHRV